MQKKFNRKTRFPDNGPALLAETHTKGGGRNLNRRTRFPGGTSTEKLRLVEQEEQQVESNPQKEHSVQLPSRLPLMANPSDVVSEASVSKTRIKSSLENQFPPVQVESPWELYKSLRHLERGGQVTVAHTRNIPVHMVIIKELVSDSFIELRKCQHENLLSIIEIYRFQNVFFVITDYTAATLKQVIAIPLPIEELHVSATCRQVLRSMKLMLSSTDMTRSLKACSIYLGLVSLIPNLIALGSYSCQMDV